MCRYVLSVHVGTYSLLLYSPFKLRPTLSCLVQVCTLRSCRDVLCLVLCRSVLTVHVLAPENGQSGNLDPTGRPVVFVYQHHEHHFSRGHGLGGQHALRQQYRHQQYGHDGGGSGDHLVWLQLHVLAAGDVRRRVRH